MATFEEVSRLLETASLAGPASEEAIKCAEDKLGVQFPPSYRQFLASCGAALCRGFEIAGLFPSPNDDGPPLWSDVVTATCQKRRASQGLIPSGYVAVSDDGGDYTFYLDTTHRGPEGGYPVLALGPGVDSVVVARGFFDFVIAVAGPGFAESFGMEVE